jgi:2-oxoisovalerate dehydrogenase E2 component (dihydrolipoyl transacylase)
VEILVGEGETVDAGTVLAYIEDDRPQTADRRPQTEDAATEDSASENSGRPMLVRPQGRPFISPVVARIAAEHNVEIDQVPGSGLHGRITKKDVLAYIGDQGSGIRDKREITAAPIAQSPDPLISNPRSPVPDPQSPVPNPLSSMRRVIAEHMTRSVRNAPHVATIHEVDMTVVVRHREDHKAALAERGIRLTFTPYFVAAVAAALRALPEVNSRFSEDGLILSRRVHIGVAVAIDDGLLVPVIHDADERNLAGLARAVNDLAERARRGQLNPDELTGGTFTITNHGMGGSLLATPIINDGQAGILGIGAIVKRPVVQSGGHPLLPSADDAILIRPMCYLSFSFDHRVLDGAEADEFVTKVKATLENWTDDSITSKE